MHIRQFGKQVWSINAKQDTPITQSWINVNKKGENHHLHSHPNSFISGVFYYHCNKNDSITFKNPNIAGHSISPKVNENAASYLAANIDFKVTTGVLILFPSWLEHNVKSNLYETPRISLSFNTQLSGIIGSSGTLTYSSVKYIKE